MQWRARKTGPPRTFSFCFGLLGHVFNVQRVHLRDNANCAATAVPSELDLAGYQREERVVVTTTDTLARVEVRATLPDDDLARVEELAAEALHAKPLRVGVTAVAAGRRALLVCHFCCPLRLLRLGLGLGDAGDPDLGVLLPVTLTALVAGLVPVVDHVDLRTLGGADDLGRYRVTAELSGVADDRAVVYHEECGERDARPGLLVCKLVDGEHVIEGDLLLPATPAHNRVHPRTASPCMRAPLPSDVAGHCGWIRNRGGLANEPDMPYYAHETTCSASQNS